MKHLTPSQKHSLLAGAGVAVVQIVANASKIEAVFPDAKWLTLALTLLGLGVTMVSRSISSNKSGTGRGVINAGPDRTAAAAQGMDAVGGAADAVVSAAAPVLPAKAVADVAAVVQVLQAIYPNAAPTPNVSALLNEQVEAAKAVLSAHAAELQEQVANTPVNFTGTLKGMSAKALADGHATIAAAVASAPDGKEPALPPIYPAGEGA